MSGILFTLETVSVLAAIIYFAGSLLGVSWLAAMLELNFLFYLLLVGCCAVLLFFIASKVEKLVYGKYYYNNGRLFTKFTVPAFFVMAPCFFELIGCIFLAFEGLSSNTLLVALVTVAFLILYSVALFLLGKKIRGTIEKERLEKQRKEEETLSNKKKFVRHFETPAAN